MKTIIFLLLGVLLFSCKKEDRHNEPVVLEIDFKAQDSCYFGVKINPDHPDLIRITDTSDQVYLFIDSLKKGDVVNVFAMSQNDDTSAFDVSIKKDGQIVYSSPGIITYQWIYEEYIIDSNYIYSQGDTIKAYVYHQEVVDTAYRRFLKVGYKIK